MEHQHDKRVVIYTSYLNSKLTVKEGRRIPKDLATENPHPLEIYESCATLKLNAELEDKCYSRDYLQRGRVRVQIKDDAGNPINPDIPTRRSLLIEVAKLVPTTQARKKIGSQSADPVGLPKLPDKKDEPAPKAAAGSSKKSGKKKK
ncbi:hypothetical protein CYMTET_51830 [Cymbomonas tetramitiformis]|uniref:Signal recognition particle 19 kDa protein n=1 Tax=Cymbomonas tetramitiformis TaxID=36881 RepID=A0AAE0BK96_9CHLO|nr:hypothetical protein CYMTET_51830 [Cymbomonas tetramitiformis]